MHITIPAAAVPPPPQQQQKPTSEPKAWTNNAIDHAAPSMVRHFFTFA
jgi:hypothetical protein